MYCEYAEHEDMVIDAIIVSVCEKRVQKWLLDKAEDLTLARAIEIPQQYEISQKQMKIVREDDTCPREDVTYSNLERREELEYVSTVSENVPPKAAGQSQKTHYPERWKFAQQKPLAFCPGCRKHFEHKWDRGKCPAKGSMCSHCHKPNHWVAVYRKRAVHTLSVEVPEEAKEEILNISLTVHPVASLTADKWSVHVTIMESTI